MTIGTVQSLHSCGTNQCTVLLNEICSQESLNLTREEQNARTGDFILNGLSDCDWIGFESVLNTSAPAKPPGTESTTGKTP